MENPINLRVRKIMKLEKETIKSFADTIGVSESTLKTTFQRDSNLNLDIIIRIAEKYPKYSFDWILTGEDKKQPQSVGQPDMKPQIVRVEEETRPRIPMNAAAGSLSVAMEGTTADYCEQMPVIRAFSRYDFTIFARGDSMEPEFHSGDELACLKINNSFVQWGRYHVLDTAQGFVVKKIYDDDEYILCRSEESDMYPDFRIHKDEIYGIGLVVGMLRRY